MIICQHCMSVVDESSLCEYCNAGIRDNLTDKELGIILSLIQNGIRRADANARKSKLPFKWDEKKKQLEHL